MKSHTRSTVKLAGPDEMPNRDDLMFLFIVFLWLWSAVNRDK